jgi:aspartyl-tRNA(Asn)/glutamyl-tRNA(Gln) amidotransferase subunit C
MAAKITQKDVEYVAGLAQLALDDATKERLAGEMGDILGYMDKLNELNTDAIEPMMHAQEMTNVYGEDEVQPSLEREEALRNAPQTDGEYFLVPKILEG